MGMLDRKSVLSKAIDDCYREMFAKAQPTADWDNLIEEYKAGKIDEDKDGPVYNRHYLSMEEYMYILNKYLEAYRVNSEWQEDVEVVEEYLNNGGNKDKYIEAHTDEDGNHHPGYRSYEEVPPLKEHILNILTKYSESETNNELAEEINNKVMDLISTCKNYYQFNVDEQRFRNTLALGATPTSNAETVKKWWKEHYNVDIEIEERNPLLFWDYEYYGDEMDEVMTHEYGENWKEVWDKKWEEEKAKKKAEKEQRLKEIQEEYDKQQNDKNK